MSCSSDDYAVMARALRLARRGLYTTDPNPRVGCVIVCGGEILGEGWHAKAGGPHAETRALEQAGEAAAGATAYVSLEPCCHQGRTPPCTAALIAAGIDRVVVGARDPNPVVAGQGITQLRAAGITVEAGLLESVSRDLNPGFTRRMEQGRPYLRSKLAVSIDGRTALANGVSKWITGEAARADVQRLRARSSAVLTGVDTVLADDPSLNVRDEQIGPVLQPLRVVVDSTLRTPATARLLGLPGAVRLFCIEPDAGRRKALEAAGARVETLPVDGAAGNRLDLGALLNRLGELEINEVLVEAGPLLNGALLEGGLIDELVIYMAAHVIGANGRGMFALPALSEMSERFEFSLRDVRRVGEDCRMTYRKV